MCRSVGGKRRERAGMVGKAGGSGVADGGVRRGGEAGVGERDAGAGTRGRIV